MEALLDALPWIVGGLMLILLLAALRRPLQWLGALAASYVPEWRWDDREPDVGVILAHLYAAMMENTISLYNRSMHNHYLAFLNLLGTRLLPPSPAEGMISVGVTPGSEGVYIDRGTAVYAAAETDSGRAREEGGTSDRDRICRLETDIDDCTGENLGLVMEKLFAAGAREVHYTPIFMKKNRPAYELSVICDPDNIRRMEEIIFRETTTIGIRRTLMERTVLKRRQENIQTPLGQAAVKICVLPDGREVCYPEYESVQSLAAAGDLSFQETYRQIQNSWDRER